MNSNRTWYNGPPPHVGWWNASFSRSKEAWRWWNGKGWSVPAYEDQPLLEVKEKARIPSLIPKSGKRIEWSDYWPENARVPRIDPK